MDEAFGMRVVSADRRHGRSSDSRPAGRGESDGRRTAAAAALAAAQDRLRKVRDRLALVTDRLRVSDKEKRDLLDAFRRDRGLDPTAAGSLRAALDREKEKNARLQAVYDQLYEETVKRRPGRPRGRNGF